MPVLLLTLLALGQAETSTAASAEDRAAEARLQAIYRRIPELEKVDARVEAGVARLSGSVQSPTADEDALRIAKETPGVVYVVDALETETEVRGRVAPALTKLEELTRKVAGLLPLLGISAVVLLVAWAASRLLTSWDWPYGRLRDRPFVDRLVRQLVRLVVVGAGLLVVLEILGITALVGALLGTAGVVGLAIGFAFQNIIENYLAGVLLSLRHPFRTGDLVELEGVTGKLVRLTARDTVLMTLEGNHVRLPNAVVFKAQIINYTLNPLRRFDFTVGVGTQESLLDVRREALATLASITGVLADPRPRFQIDALGDSAVIVHLFAWVDQTRADYFAVRTEAVRRVKVALEDNGHDLPEPIYRVVMRQEAAQGPKAAEPVLDDSLLEQEAPEEPIDAQIARDQRSSREKNLLDEDPGTPRA